MRSCQSKNKCILKDSWTQWVGAGTCGEVTRTRSYQYSYCEYKISFNFEFKSTPLAILACITWFSADHTGRETQTIQKSPCRKLNKYSETDKVRLP